MAPILNLFHKLTKTSLDGNVYGLHWVPNSTTLPTLMRITVDQDPYQYVTATIDSEPNLTSSYSPCDSLYPWKDMEIYYFSGTTPIKHTGGTTYTANRDYYVYIPTFYYKIICQPAQVGNSTVYLWFYYISDEPNTEAGFQKHPGSDRYIGKYLHGYTNISEYTGGGNVPLRSQTGKIAKGNTYSSLEAKGSGHKYTCDVATYFAVKLLCLFEYGTFDLISKIGGAKGGITTGSTPFTTGTTNNISYHTGTIGQRIKYRHIEDLYGAGGEGYSSLYIARNTSTNRNEIYTKTTPTNSTSINLSNYTKLSFTPAASSGFIENFGYDSNAPWCCFIPISTTNDNSVNKNNNRLYSSTIGTTSYPSVYYTTESPTSVARIHNLLDCTYESRTTTQTYRCNARLVYIP